MTDPCLPPVMVVSKAARLAWRVRHPFRRVGHGALDRPGTTQSVVAPPVTRPALGCEGVVSPDGARVLPALPGKPAAVAARTIAAAGGAFATGAALAGAGLSGASGMSDVSSAGRFGGLGTPLSNAVIYSSPGFDSPAGPLPDAFNTTRVLIADRVDASPADFATSIPAPGLALLFFCLAVMTVVLRRQANPIGGL